MSRQTIPKHKYDAYKDEFRKFEAALERRLDKLEQGEAEFDNLRKKNKEEIDNFTDRMSKLITDSENINEPELCT